MTIHHDSPGSDVATTTHDALPERFENPGLPAHRHRTTDIDPKATRRAERQVAGLFGLSAVGTVLAMVAYFAVKLEGDREYDAYLQQIQLSNTLLGLGFFLSLFCIGAGAVHWAKTLMPDEERVEERHDLRGSDADRADALAILREGAAEAGLGRRPLIRNSLFAALGLVGLPGIVLLRDSGPMPGNALSTTFWKPGMRLVTDQAEGGKPLKASDLQLGSVAHVMPEGIEKTAHLLEERGKAALLVIRLDPKDLDAKSVAGSYDGIVAYSKICTHMGCPVALYEQQTHHLLCPCHQSTFDLTQDCKVIFGPAKRPLPQLAITVDDDGYLIAKESFQQAVGPSFWERG